MFHKLFRTENDYSLTVLRVVLGVVFFAHGAQKALGWFGGPGFTATMDSFTKMGVPAFLAFLVILAEFGGGLGLIFGFLSRIAALGVATVMTVAILAVHSRVGFFMNWTGAQQGEGFEYHLLALALCFAVLVKGAGALSIDGWLWRRATAQGGRTTPAPIERRPAA